MQKNRIYILIIGCLLLFSSCELKEEPVYKQTPDERLAKILDEYSAQLESAPNGWFMSVDTEANGGYLMWLTFNDKKRVTMLCDMDATYPTEVATSTQPRESSFILKGLQMPSLLFDTYNYIHLMADPQGSSSHGNINGGVNGQGLVSDFEFDIYKYDGGVFILHGIYNGRSAFLYRATPQEAQAVIAGGLKSVHEKLIAYVATLAEPMVTINDIDIKVKLESRRLTLTYSNSEGKEIVVKSGVYMDMTAVTQGATSSNMKLFTPLQLMDKDIVAVRWEGVNYSLVSTDNSAYHIYDNAIYNK